MCHTVEVDGKKLTLKEGVTRWLGLERRGTDVVCETCETLEQEKSPEGKGGMVAKVYWAEEAQISEDEILGKVKGVAEKDEAVRGHAPDVLLAKGSTVSTSTIRKALGLEDPNKGSRTLFLLICKKLSPTKELQGDNLFDAWRQCVLCHYVLWKAGIYHRDVSCNNLMYYYRDEGDVVGVLNDYDLASLKSSDIPLGNERTGTTPFMAIDLLCADGQAGNVKHLYRHDMESFIWVFVWISMQYKDGKLRIPGPLDAWAKVNASGCVYKKSRFLVASPVPDDTLQRLHVLAVVRFLAKRHVIRDNSKADLELAKLWLSEDLTLDAAQIAKLQSDLVEQSDDDVFRKFAKQIRVDTTSVEAIISRSRNL
ncbi:hypothetical protein BDN67DRAFT_1013749 [Paxillus ammoniavirescens]|nr:hypothetical protein BDN67DRAFT_1013749 [Paxillus ammoniavirescens]